MTNDNLLVGKTPLSEFLESLRIFEPAPPGSGKTWCSLCKRTVYSPQGFQTMITPFHPVESHPSTGQEILGPLVAPLGRVCLHHKIMPSPHVVEALRQAQGSTAYD